MKPAMWEGGRREPSGDGEKREGLGGWPTDVDRRGERGREGSRPGEIHGTCR